MAGSVPSSRSRGRRWLLAILGIVLVAWLIPDLWVYWRGISLADRASAAAPGLLLVPGASVLRNGKPSPVLRQRVETALEAARRWPSTRIVLSGTAVVGGYDEPLSMRNYLLEHGVDSLRLILDREGTSTRTSINNLGRPTGSLAVVSQRWHLARACWLAEMAGWDVRGLVAGPGTSAGWENILRENFVRAQNFWELIFRRAAAQVVSFPSER